MTLQELRKAAGFNTQEMLAQKIGAKREAIAQWEIGAAYPRTPLIPVLAQALDVTADEIIAAIMAAKAEHKSSA